MGIAIIPKDKKAMKGFVGKTREWIEGFTEGVSYVLGFVNGKIGDLEERKPKLFDESSKYAMQMSIDELKEIREIVKDYAKTKEEGKNE